MRELVLFKSVAYYFQASNSTSGLENNFYYPTTSSGSRSEPDEVENEQFGHTSPAKFLEILLRIQNDDDLDLVA